MSPNSQKQSEKTLGHPRFETEAEDPLELQEDSDENGLDGLDSDLDDEILELDADLDIPPERITLDKGVPVQGEALIGERLADQALVRRIQKGDKQAFNLLVLKYQSKIEKVIARYIRDTHEVSDVAQETFIKAYRALARFRGDSSFYTWIYRIAINTAKNYLTAAHRRPPGTDIDASDATLYEGESFLKEYATPEHVLLRDEIERIVFQAINDLPTELRIAIILRELEGLSYEEIADLMNCPLGTVRSRIFRAREAIDSSVQPLLSD